MKSNNLKHLVDEIFNMAKLDANEFPLKEEELDFSEVTREVLIEFYLSSQNIILNYKFSYQNLLFLSWQINLALYEL